MPKQSRLLQLALALSTLASCFGAGADTIGEELEAMEQRAVAKIGAPAGENPLWCTRNAGEARKLFDVYDRPGSGNTPTKKIGELVAVEHPAAAPSEECYVTAHLKLANGTLHAYAESGTFVAYEKPGFFAVETSTDFEGVAPSTWAKVEFGKLRGWFKVQAPFRVLREDENRSRPFDFRVTCTAPGLCKPATPEFLAELERVRGGSRILSPYSVVSIDTSPLGPFYRLVLSKDNLRAGMRHSLPAQLWIPTRDAKGASTVEHDGC